MTELDLAKLRKDTIDARSHNYHYQWGADTKLALLDALERLTRLVKQRDEWLAEYKNEICGICWTKYDEPKEDYCHVCKPDGVR